MPATPFLPLPDGPLQERAGSGLAVWPAKRQPPKRVSAGGRCGLTALTAIEVLAARAQTLGVRPQRRALALLHGAQDTAAFTEAAFGAVLLGDGLRPLTGGPVFVRGAHDPAPPLAHPGSSTRGSQPALRTEASCTMETGGLSS